MARKAEPGHSAPRDGPPAEGSPEPHLDLPERHGALPERHRADLQIVSDRRALLGLLPRHGVVAELGVERGAFSAQILAVNQPARLHLIDPWDTARFGEPELAAVRAEFGAELAAKKVLLHRGYSHQMLADFPDGYFDWIYIDTDHSYETTAAELLACRRKVAAGGLIAGHDYSEGNRKKNLRYGVIAAVNEFCVRCEWEMIYLTSESSGYLSYVLREMAH